MIQLRIITTIFYYFCVAHLTLLAQDYQGFNVLFSNYYTNDFNKDEFYTGSTMGNFGIGTEVRYRFNNKKDPFKTAIGIAYHQLSFKEQSEIFSFPSPNNSSKERFHLVSLPIYFVRNIGQNLEVNFHLSLEIPFLKTSKSFEGNIFLNKHSAGINPISNMTIGTGLAFRYYLPIKKKESFFLELFFKRHALFLELNTNENFYLDRIKKPFAIGLNIGLFL